MPFDLKKFRAALRAAREACDNMGRDALAAKAGIAKSTIQSAEMGPDVPQIDTVARIIEALPGLTLSSFFAQIEGLSAPAQPAEDQTHQPQSPAQAVTDERPVPTQLSPDAATLRTALAVVAYLTRALIRARAAAEVRGPTPSDRTDVSTRPTGRARGPRQHHRRTNKGQRRKR